MTDSPFPLEPTAAQAQAEEAARVAVEKAKAAGYTELHGIEADGDGWEGEGMKQDGKKYEFKIDGRTGEACPVCGDTVREVSFADSSLQYCPTCQTGGKPLADRRMSRLLK